jgi:pSer/pThr/pTyr-binding forkhead associated (FHA) protein
MPKLIVCSKEMGDGLFTLPEGETVIGRGNDVGLLLPNVSVSREHAKVTVTGDVIEIADLDSRNGTMVNGDPVESRALASGDEIQVGKYVLIFLGDDRAHQFYRGRYVGYMQPYQARAVFTEDSTFAISPDHLQQMQREQAIIRGSKVTLAANPTKFWHPEDRCLTFGGEGMIHVDGWLTAKIVAELTWNGQSHVLQKHARIAKVLVNERPVTEQALVNGDRIRIGNTRFRYESPVD